MTKVMDVETHEILYRCEAEAEMMKPDVELDAEILEEEWLDADYGFFIRQGSIYHTAEFEIFLDPDREECLQTWDGYQGWTYFSGIVIKLLTEEENGEMVMTGIYQS